MDTWALQADLLGAFEVHSPEEIRRIIASGLSPTSPIEDKRPIDCLIEAYLRTDRFPECLRAMLDAGASTGDSLLEALLLDDEIALGPLLESGEALERRLGPLTAFTSCRDVSALHICAEFGSFRCARALLDAGADVNARAVTASGGIGGHTAIFHTVNSIFNFGRPTMELLVERGADLDLRVPAILWGESFPWETIVFDVTPLSYAQCGLYRQFHRDEEAIFSNIDFLHRARFGSPAPRRNIPNAYLRG